MVNLNGSPHSNTKPLDGARSSTACFDRSHWIEWNSINSEGDPRPPGGNITGFSFLEYSMKIGASSHAMPSFMPPCGVAQRSLSMAKRAKGCETMQTRTYYPWQGLTRYSTGPGGRR
jgi:hypothetical protein